MYLKVPFMPLSPYAAALRVLVATLAVVLVAVLGTAVPTATAQERCAAHYTELKWKEGSLSTVDNTLNEDGIGQADIEFKWSLAEGAKVEDQFKVTLPDQLMAVGTSETQLKDDSGNHIATAAIDAGGKEVVFTLTDDAEKHPSASGSAHFSVERDRNVSGSGSEEPAESLTFGGCGSGVVQGVHISDGQRKNNAALLPAGKSEAARTHDAGEVGRISLTKKIGGLGSAFSGGSSQNPREFDVEASWTDEKGVKQTREIKISEGKITELEPIPVGTELFLREIKPKNTALTTWSTPGFSTTNRAVELKDNGDGTASLLVSTRTVKEAALIEVHNTANIPWWWILVPTLPLFIPPLLPSGSSSSSMPVTPATSAPQPAPKNVPAPKDADKKPKKLLAKTGAEIGVVAILGMLAIFAGLILVLRRRNS